MFRFSIRDVLWLTLAVALALGWGIRERQLRGVADRAIIRADKWRMAAGALEHYFVQGGWKVKWDWEASQVELDSNIGYEAFGKAFISTNAYPPSSPD